MRSPTTRSTRAAVLVAALLAFAGCGGDGPATSGTVATTAATGTVPVPVPPPATVTGTGGTVVMAGYGGCWSEGGVQVCGDPEWPVCPASSLPVVRAPVGGTLTFRLAVAAPSAVELTTGDGTRTVALTPGVSAEWTVTVAEGPLVLRARVPGRGDPAWAACLEPPPR